LYRLFYGTTRQRILPASGAGSRHSIHEKDDLFSDLAVNVSGGGFDIYDGLSCYFVDNNVEFEGTAARMETSLVDLPPLLHIRLQVRFPLILYGWRLTTINQRVQFHQGQQEAFKSQAYVSFTETITMDRFLENADPEKKARSHELQEQLAQSRKRMKKFKKTTV
jgi:ubiquitin carboxyl-terminal hydrolase 25/28